MDEGLRNAVISAAIAGIVPLLVYAFAFSRRFGKLEEGLSNLKSDRGILEGRLETDRRAFREQFDVLNDKLDKHRKEFADGVSALTAALGETKVDLVERIGNLETRVVDRVGQLEGESGFWGLEGPGKAPSRPTVKRTPGTYCRYIRYSSKRLFSKGWLSRAFP